MISIWGNSTDRGPVVWGLWPLQGCEGWAMRLEPEKWEEGPRGRGVLWAQTMKIWGFVLKSMGKLPRGQLAEITCKGLETRLMDPSGIGERVSRQLQVWRHGWQWLELGWSPRLGTADSGNDTGLEQAVLGMSGVGADDRGGIQKDFIAFCLYHQGLEILEACVHWMWRNGAWTRKQLEGVCLLGLRISLPR